MQGYLFSPPLPAGKFEKLLTAQKRIVAPGFLAQNVLYLENV